MAVYSDTDLRGDKRLKFTPVLGEPGPCSWDLHVGRLYAPPDLREGDVDLPWAEFRKRLEKVPTTDWHGEEAWLLQPHNLYLAETAERITLPKGLAADIDTRSSWARYGVRVQSVDNELHSFRGYEGHIPVNIVAFDVPVVLRPGDRTCQAVVSDSTDVLSARQIREAFKSGDLKYRGSEGYKLEIRGDAIGLTLHPIIKTFNDVLIDPKKDMSAKYSVKDITAGYLMPEYVFFLGSSNEIVEMGINHVGLLRELTLPPRSSVWTHLNSGYHVPGSNGTLTFEHYFYRSKMLRPRMPMGELEILPLRSPCSRPYDSKYRGQAGPTPTRPDNSSTS